MKRVSRILPFVAAVMLAAVAAFGQGTGAISGKVVDRDGKTPVVGATVYVDSLITERGQIVLRERLTTRTGRDGSYSQNGIYAGRVRVTVVINNVPVMVVGEATGDEIFIANGLDARANVDLSKAPATPPAVATAAPAGGDADREAARARFEKEAKDAAEMQAAFEAGKAAFTAKNYEEAITHFKAATEKDPKVDIIWANLGRAYDANKNYEEAVGAYSKAIELKPTESNYFLNLSLIQISMGKMEEGKVSIEKAASLNPANAGLAYYNLGATLINRNKPQDALEPLKKAVELDPKYANAHYQLGMTYIQLGNMNDAVPALQKYVDLAPNDPQAQVAKELINVAKATPTTGFSAAPAAPAAGSKAPAGNQNKGGR